MDKKEEQNEVSLPGAGRAEPTILEVLNRNVIGECDNEVTAQHPLPQELHPINEDRPSDDISRGGISDTNQLEIRYTAPKPVTDLDLDDNEKDNDRVLELQIAEDSSDAQGACGQIISELETKLPAQVKDRIPNSSDETKSVECDIVQFDNTALSESNTACKLVDLRQPIIDSKSGRKKRLSSVEEQSNESESSYSDDSNRHTLVTEAKHSDTSRPWYQDDDLDPEDQRIIQEAVESILKDAKKQLAEERVNFIAVEEDIKPNEPTIPDLPPLQTPNLPLPNPLSHSVSKEDSLLKESVDLFHRAEVNSDQTQKNLITEISDSDSGVTSPNVKSSQPVNEDSDTYKNITDVEEPCTSINSPSEIELISLDSGVPSLNSETLNQSTEDAIANSLGSNSTSPEQKVFTPESSGFLTRIVLQPESNDEKNQHSSHLENIETIEPNSSITEIFFSEIKEHKDRLTVENTSQSPESETTSLCSEAKKEYYQRLRDFLNSEELNRPPVPLKTYQWEDLRRSKKQGGYPWTHLYKRPLGPGEDPEIITLRRSQERQKFSSESPRSVKKVVRIHEEVLVKETERYISDLSDNETDEGEDHHEDQRGEQENYQEDTATSSPPGDNFSIQSEPILSVSSDDKSTKITRIKGILKRRLSFKQSKPASAPESRAEEATPTARKRRFIGSQKIVKCCHPIMNKLKSMADKQLKRRNIKKVPLKDNEKIILSEKQKILKLKASPKADHGQIPHFIEKQDSDDVLEILELEESPSKTRRCRQDNQNQQDSGILVPDEIIELPTRMEINEDDIHLSPQVSESQCERSSAADPSELPIRREGLKFNLEKIPRKFPRRQKEHVYEDIEDKDIEYEIDEILQEAAQSAARISEQIQEEIRNASSEKELPEQTLEAERTIELKIIEDFENDNQLESKDLELKSALKRESSPGADKRVTFSHTEDEAEPHREDITLPEEYRIPSRYTDNHEYEPIGLPSDGVQTQEHTNVEKEPSPIPTFEISEPPTSPTSEKEEEIASLTSIEKELAHEENEHVPSVLEQQREIEERYFSSVPTTPRTDSRTDNEIHTSQVDSSAIEELPLKTENRKKSFMASAQDRSRRMTQNIRSQAGKIKTRIRGPKKASSGSPKPKEKKRFKKPDFSKIKMPEMKRPELPKFKAPEMPKFKPPEFKRPEFKRPEFTKFEKPIFTKPDLSRFKIPDTMTLKLRRSKSLRETEPATATTETTSESPVTPVAAASPKKRFEFNFGTYPRMLKKRKQKLSTIVIAKADDLPSTETPPSVESTTLPRQVGGPVSPRWNEKSSEVSYGDSESGKYQRYESVMGSLGRESSLERRIKEELERSARKQEELELLESIEQKQFADYDEENRAIHEISKIRENEFKKRRPIMHQDSDLVSEESKDVGWSDKDVIRNAMLRGAEESDVEMMQKTEKYPSEEVVGSPTVNTSHETQSTASSGIRQKGVIEEIDDDEFILRKRGISQDNIEIRQYISSAIREGLTTPINTLAQLGSKDSYYPDMDVSNEDVNYGYDVPPPKPKRANKFLNDFDSARDTESRELSQEFEAERRGSFEDNTSLPHSGENYFANMPPSRPTRRSRRKHYPREEDHQVPSENIAYLDDEEDNALFKKMNIDSYKQHQVQASHEDHGEHNEEHIERYQTNPPKAPKRRKKQLRDSVDKDSYANRFAGRSVSNSFLPSEERDEDFIVYRTQHEYIIPLAQAETFSTPTPAPRRSRSRSQSRITDDDRTSHGAESLASESFPLVENKFHIDMKETDGYATVRKDPPPRPPAPTRQRKGSPLLNQHFSTMPHKKRSVSSTERLKRNFHTMGPSRPPRRRSSASMGDSKKDVSSPDVTQYEELDIDDVRDEQDRENRVESPRGDLHSGDVINKMKYRPLPPPPRPPRESRKKGRRDYSDHFDDRDNKDDGAERITCDLQLNGDYNVEKHTEKCIEVEVSTQTDPLPDDFVCEEFEITEDMRVIEPRVGRTLQDILKQEEQSTDQQEHEDDSLIKSLQRFREASQRSYSERSRASTADRSRASHGSRPATPSVVVIERRIPTPIPNRQGETMLEASLFVMPLDDAEYDDEEETEDEVPKEDFEHVNEATTRTMQQEEEERLTKDQLEHKSLHHTPINGKQELSEEEEDEIPPPIAPPRKRSSVTAEVSPLIDDDVLPSRTAFISARTDIEPLNEQDVERSSPFPTRLTLAELEVERLSVNELQAANITVSQLQSSIVRTDELECRSSNVAQPLEITENLIEEIVRRVRSAEKEKESDTAGTQPMEPHRPEPGESPTVPTTFESPPPRPPPPQIQLQGPQHPSIFPSEYMQYSVPPPSFYTLRDPSEAEPHHSPPHRRRRHHRRRDSSSEEDSHREHHRSRHSTRSPEPTIGQLGAQFLQACGSSFMRSVSHIVNILRANTKEGNDRNISTAIVLVILVTIGFLLLGITGNKNIHHHHWDYFNPPDHKGRE